jgi:hypothetical protein
VRIQEVAPARALELFISSAQWIDAWTPPLEDGIDRLAHALQTLLAADGGEPPTVTASRGPTPALGARARRESARAPSRRAAEESRGRGVLIAGVAAALLAVVVGGALWRGSRVTGPGVVLDVEEPRGAEILVDGRLVGQSSARPKQLALTAGAHRLKVQAEGYWPYEQTIEVSGAEPETLQVKLARSNTLAVAVTPSDAKIAINGKTIDRPFPIELRDGRHTVDVNAPGYEPYRHVVELDGGRRESLVVTLNPTGKRAADAGAAPRRSRTEIDRSVPNPPVPEPAVNEPAPRPEPPQRPEAPAERNPWTDFALDALRKGVVPRPPR